MRRRRRSRRYRRNPVSKKTLYWILGGVGVVSAGGLIYWLATRNKELTQGGGSGTPSNGVKAPRQVQGGGGLPPPTSSSQQSAPKPTEAIKTPQGYNTFLQDASNFVNTLKGIGVTVGQIVQLYNNLVNVVAQQFQISLPSLVPANLGLSAWPPGVNAFL